MEFEEYCLQKKIDTEKFSNEEPVLFQELKEYFSKIHPESFTQQKKFLINPIRRRYPLLILDKNQK